jgi:hypothetical protein
LQNIRIEPHSIYGWQGQRMSAGPLSMILTPAIGGRIISLRYEGREFLFVDKEHAGETFEFGPGEDIAARKAEIGFRLWGGDKTWVAPQSQWVGGTPSLDLDAGPYALTWEEKQAVMTSPICRETGLRIVRKVHIDGELTVHLQEELHNTTDLPVTRSIWNVTQVLRPCEFYIPAGPGAFRSYHHEDPTLPQANGNFKEAEGWVEVPCRSATLFKCGGTPREGKVLIKMPLRGGKELVWLKTFGLDPRANFAHRSAVEVFNSPTLNYAEIELHAPLAEILPGASCVFSQQWQFRKAAL